MIDIHVTDIARVVQQVLAPAFLLAGIGTFLTMMTQRLARIIDRAVRQFAVSGRAVRFTIVARRSP